MNKLMTLAMICLLPAIAANAGTAKTWIDTDDKIVAIAPNPTLQVELAKLEVDDTYYAQLKIDLAYEGLDMDAQIKTALAGYPGYRLQRVILEKGDKYHFEIPLLGVSQEFEPVPGVDGPYLHDVRFLTKAQYNAAVTEISSKHPLASVTGSLVATVPVMKTIEHKEVNPSYCEILAGHDQSVGSVMMRIASLASSGLDDLTFENESTRLSLMTDIRDNCLEIVQGAQVNSFADLMDLKVRAKNPGRNLVGETHKRTLEKQSIPLGYELKQIRVQ